MDAVAELMRERHHVARLALIVQQHIGMDGRNRRMREGAGRLAGTRRRVDPALVEEPFGDRRHFRREPAIGVEHRLARLVPADHALHRLRERRVAVPVLQPVLAEPAGLEGVVAMRQARIGVVHRRDERIDDLRLDPVRQVPRRSDVGEAAPLVGDRLVLRQHVGDEGEEADVLLEGDGERGSGGGPFLLLRLGEPVQRFLQRQAFAGDIEAQRRQRFVEKPVPGAAPGHGFLVEELLDAVVELVGALGAQVVEERLVGGELRRLQRLRERRVVDAVQLQREEQELCRDGGQAILQVAIEFRAGGIGRVARIDQAGIAAEAAEDFLDALIGANGFGERGAARFPDAIAPRVPL